MKDFLIINEDRQELFSLMMQIHSSTEKMSQIGNE